MHHQGAGQDTRVAHPRARTRVTVTRVTSSRPKDPGGQGQPLPPTAALEARPRRTEPALPTA